MIPDNVIEFNDGFQNEIIDDKKEVFGIYQDKMKKKAIIISIKGTKLSKKENTLIKRKTRGLILFKRNIQSINQVQKLTKKIREYSKDNKFPILIDEEEYSV